MTAALQLAGRTFGRLTVIERAGGAAGHSLWLCHCECGATSTVPGVVLVQGKSRSCGCLSREVSRASGKKNTRHGHTYSPTHRSWSAMKTRCLDPGSKDYPRYGARGISICARWMTFENFLQDMGARPDGTSLDRWPNQSGNYEPGNCRWATPAEQTRNSSTATLLEMDGRTECIADWAALTGLKAVTIGARVKRGWSIRDALTRKVSS